MIKLKINLLFFFYIMNLCISTSLLAMSGEDETVSGASSSSASSLQELDDIYLRVRPKTF